MSDERPTVGDLFDRYRRAKMSAYSFTAGICWACGSLFTFNPHLVPSVPIDPETNRPADLGGDPERAVRQPICADCISVANSKRTANGQPLIEVLPGAYDPLEGVPSDD